MKPERKPSEWAEIRKFNAHLADNLNAMSEKMAEQRKRANWFFLGASALGGVAAGEASGSVVVGVAAGLALELGTRGLRLLDAAHGHMAQEKAALLNAVAVNEGAYILSPEYVESGEQLNLNLRK